MKHHAYVGAAFHLIAGLALTTSIPAKAQEEQWEYDIDEQACVAHLTEYDLFKKWKVESEITFFRFKGDSAKLVVALTAPKWTLGPKGSTLSVTLQKLDRTFTPSRPISSNQLAAQVTNPTAPTIFMLMDYTELEEWATQPRTIIFSVSKGMLAGVYAVPIKTKYHLDQCG